MIRTVFFQIGYVGPSKEAVSAFASAVSWKSDGASGLSGYRLYFFGPACFVENNLYVGIDFYRIYGEPFVRFGIRCVGLKTIACGVRLQVDCFLPGFTLELQAGSARHIDLDRFACDVDPVVRHLQVTAVISLDIIRVSALFC